MLFEKTLTFVVVVVVVDAEAALDRLGSNFLPVNKRFGGIVKIQLDRILYFLFFIFFVVPGMMMSL